MGQTRSGYLLIFEIISVHLLVVLDRRRLPGAGQTKKHIDRGVGQAVPDMNCNVNID